MTGRAFGSMAGAFASIMSNEHAAELSRSYLLSVILLTLVLPALSIVVECLTRGEQIRSPILWGKWVIFWAVGVRLLTAGLRQVLNPSFTARAIFNIEDHSSHAIVRELGFANICFGATGIISLFVPSWRVVSAFASGLFYGIAGISHIVKKPAGPNEVVALASDIFLFALLAAYLFMMI